MHIKEISIEGFKTYKELTVFSDLDPGQNIILGKNGSGKSNVFDAIQFVLSDKYANMRHDERQRLLHEGAGREIMTASVELVFDNTDNRFPLEKPEVRLKRTIGLKKDEYFIDNKHMQKSEVVSMLESAGLSRSNPYYIVQQGEVRRLIHMKDKERLDLLKDIAGTRTYDDRRKESLKIIAETDKRRGQIDEVIVYIEKRLSELQEEKSELNRFQELDTSRRCLEFSIYNRELTEAVEQLDQMEGSRDQKSGKTDVLHARLAEAKNEAQEIEEALKVLEEDLSNYKAKKSKHSKQLAREINRHAKMELMVKEVQEKVSSNKAVHVERSKEQKSLAKQVEKCKAKLETLRQDHEVKLEADEHLKEAIRSNEAELAGLYDKQGRKDQFTSKADRDRFLKKEIGDVQTTSKSEQKQLAKIEKSNGQVGTTMLKTSKEVKHKTAAMDKVKAELDAATTSYHALKEERNTATNERKELWRKENALDGGLRGYHKDLDKVESRLQFSMDKNVFKGLQAMRRIVKDQKLPGVHGPLLELFDCEDKFQKCVETTAGNSLFHVVVDNDDVASAIIKEMNKDRNGGRVTFVPLNRITAKEQTYPKSMEIFPMIQKLNFDPKYKAAMLQVFGKTLVARDLETAASYANSQNFDTITLQGDQVNKRGALTGGYIDHKHSRLQTMKEIKKAKAEFQGRSEEAAEVKELLAGKDAKVTQVLSEIEKLTEKRTHLRNTYQQHQLDHSSMEKTLAVQKDEFARNEKVIQQVKQQLAQLGTKESALAAELKSDFQDTLSPSDQKKLSEIQALLTGQKKQLVSSAGAVAKVHREVAGLEAQLETNLLKRQSELASEIHSQAADEASELLEREAQDLDLVSDAIAELEGLMQEEEKSAEVGLAKQNSLSATLEKLKTVEAETEKRLLNESKGWEKMRSKRQLCERKRAECTDKIRELGALPKQAYSDKYKKLTAAKVMKKLEAISANLKDYSHVNKKALDQHMSFTDQREDLLLRKKELDKGRTAIDDLILHLDTKKDEAIERTFKTIAKHFSTVFAELVPNGRGTIIMNSRQEGKGGSGDDSDDHEEKKQEDRGSGLKKYTGVSIKVSFTGSRTGDQSMLQLSGGQQTVVALSLIFAIQRCDPSPFYLFDEIDSNLDAIHRTSVSRMIAQQSDKAQFLCTTFRPEMLAKASKFYGVSFQNKASLVSHIDQDEAKELILVVEQQMNEAKK